LALWFRFSETDVLTEKHAMFQSLLFALNKPLFWTRDFVLDFKDQLQLFSVVFVITLYMEGRQ